MAMTNAQLWDYIRSKFPTFKSHTSKSTADMFTDSGFEALKAGDYPDILNDFFELTLRVFLQQINVSRAEDTLSRDGFGEYYDQPNGGYIQRMSIDSVKPISSAYKGLKNGDSPDPFVVRKPTVAERFWRQNFDYASLLTIPDDFQFKQIFISEFGMSEYMGGLMTALQNGYTIQLYENKLEAINAGLNSEKHPLQETQKMTVELSADPTTEELKQFILSIRNLVDAMCMGPQNNGFNAMHFSTMQDKTRLKLLVRPGIKNAIAVKLLANSYNIEELNLPIDVIEVPHFGGLVPYADADYKTQLYPVYDKLGSCIGFNEVEGADTVTVEEVDVFWKDPNADTFAIVADKGWLFYNVQNPYRVEPIRNPRGLYTNYWASSPNNTVSIDPIYNVVAIKNS